MTATQLEAFYPGPYIEDSVIMEIAPEVCPTCDEPQADCEANLCGNCEECQQECSCVMCERCSDSVSEYDTQTVILGYRRSQLWCDECASYYASHCDGCNDYHSEDSYTQHCGDCGSDLCESCSESGYWCEDCDSWSCCNDGDCCNAGGLIGGYHEGNPQGLVMHGQGSWFMGIELELSADRDMAEHCLAVLGGHENVHFEQDGSVHDGWEFIFQPRTLASWQQFVSTGIFAKLHSAGVRGGQHGFHVHVSKAAFKTGNAVRRFADIMSGRGCDDSKAMLEELAGRQENSWAMFEAHNRRAVAKQALKGYVPQRYRGAVNLSTGKATFELRLGSGTTNPIAVLAWLETIAAAVEWANALTLELEALGGCSALALADFVAGKPQYSHADAAMRSWALAQL